MTSPLQYALMVGPLAFYLWLLACWNSGQSPRVVSGLVDHALLVFGVGGVLAFGPLGQLAARLIFGKPDGYDWIFILAALGLVSTLLARRSLHRLVVYHVDAETITRVLEETLDDMDGRFEWTLGGFEDRASARGLRVEIGRRLRSALIEAYGSEPERLIQEVRSRLREALRGRKTAASAVAMTLFGSSIAVMVAPLIGLFLTQPKARAALRVWLERLRGV